MYSTQEDLGNYLKDVEATRGEMERDDLVGRIWKKDYTVWKPHPTEIRNRLGWLTVMELMSEKIESLVSFADEIRDDGYNDVVLLGMGGSSLGSEVLRQTFNDLNVGPRLTVLDSTVPAAVQAVADSIDLEKTLFLVSSKSGGTIETLSLYAYFMSLVAEEFGEGRAAQNFVAITDPGTPLAEEKGFRRIFLNPPDIGGRYSVLSFFGMVPAALMGIDVKDLIDRAKRMLVWCATSATIHRNPGAWLGVVMGTLARQGRDKLTLITSPAIAGFGLWVEQLLAESTGKEGKGILPVVGEPPIDPSKYGSDRLFVYIRLRGDENEVMDRTVELVKDSGQPLVVLEMGERYDLGAEFFRWEFATAVAGALLGINPFDQPNVQSAKDMTAKVLKEYQDHGRLPEADTDLSRHDLLANAKQGDYLAIMAFLHQTPELDQAFSDFRLKVMERFGIATTLGYGPRFLHSTGQLHKGGPDTGLFLQVTVDHPEDMPIPGKVYSFGVLADAEALGDLKALQGRGRRAVKVHLAASDANDVNKLADEIF